MLSKVTRNILDPETGCYGDCKREMTVPTCLRSKILAPTTFANPFKGQKEEICFEKAVTRNLILTTAGSRANALDWKINRVISQFNTTLHCAHCAIAKFNFSQGLSVVVPNYVRWNCKSHLKFRTERAVLWSHWQIELRNIAILLNLVIFSSMGTGKSGYLKVSL